jgi:hypothetical protein
MIRTEIDNGRGEMRTLTVHDPEYWEGPYRYEPYPKCLFRATGPNRSDLEEAVVKSDAERTALGPAWAETPDDARAWLKAFDDTIAKAAAEANYGVTKMSKKAQAEFEAQTVKDEMEMTTDVTPSKHR